MARRSDWSMTPLALPVCLALVLAASSAGFAQGLGGALSGALGTETEKLPGLEGDSGNGAGAGGQGGGPAIATPTPGVIPVPPSAPDPNSDSGAAGSPTPPSAPASAPGQPPRPQDQAVAPGSEEDCFRRAFAAAQASMIDQFGRQIGTITVDEAKIRADCARVATDRQFRSPPDLTPPPAREARAGGAEPVVPPPVAGEQPDQAQDSARSGAAGQPATGRPAPPPVAGRPNPALSAAYDARVADGLRRLGVAPRATVDGQPIYRGFSPSIARAFGLSEQAAIVAGAYQEGVPAERIMRELNLTPDQLSELLDTYFRTAQGVSEAGVRARMIADYLAGAPAGAASTSG